MSLYTLSAFLFFLVILGTIAVAMVWNQRGDRYYQTLREQGLQSDCQATRKSQ